MSTYYKDTLSGNPIYRIAAARVTYEKLDGSIGELNLAGGGGGGSTAWGDITGKPAVIAAGATVAAARTAIEALPSTVVPIPNHSGTLNGSCYTVFNDGSGSGDLKALSYTQLTTALNGVLAPSWANITGKPAVAASGANSDITSLTGLTTALSVAQGGTGVTTVLALAAGLGIGFMVPGQVVQTIGNVDTIVDNGVRAMTTTTTGRPSGTANGDIIITFVSGTFGAQVAILNSDKLVFRTYNAGTTSWRAWKDVTATTLA